MNILLFYDIPNDRQRDKAASLCLDAGLDRVQYSVFEGRLSIERQAALMARLHTLIGDQPARVFLYPIDSASWGKRQKLDQGMRPLTPTWPDDALLVVVDGEPF